MQQFKKPELSDKQWVDAIVNDTANQSCELCFGYLFMWSRIYDNLIAKKGNMLIVKNSFGNDNQYSMPIGNGDIEEALNFIIEDAKSENKRCRIFGVTATQTEKLESINPGMFEFVSDRNLFDYIYSVERLATLSGKKLHSKRNHIANFKKLNPEWIYEKIDETNIKDCIEMHKDWIAVNVTDEFKNDYQNEFKAVSVGFENYFELGFSGGLLRLNGKVIAYTFGEKISGDIFCTHFEKAYSSIRGVYPFINQLFAQNNLSSYKYVNREEDMGLESLRKAKLSYHPDILLEKSIAIYRG